MQDVQRTPEMVADLFATVRHTTILLALLPPFQDSALISTVFYHAQTKQSLILGPCFCLRPDRTGSHREPGTSEKVWSAQSNSSMRTTFAARARARFLMCLRYVWFSCFFFAMSPVAHVRCGMFIIIISQPYNKNKPYKHVSTVFVFFRWVWRNGANCFAMLLLCLHHKSESNS